MRKQRSIFAIACITACLFIIPTRCISPPIGLRAFVVSPNVFRVKWVENYRNAKKSSIYTLRYRQLSGEDNFQFVNTTKEEIKRLNVLTSNGSYEFSVKAIRGRKESHWSEPVLRSLDLDMRVGPPRGLKVKDVSATSIKIKWRRPKSKRHSISGYQISWRVVGTKITIVKQTTERTFELNNLKPGAAYIIRVQTLSDKGFFSQPTKTTVRTHRKITLPPPSNFTVDVFGSTKLLVKWATHKTRDLSKVTGFQIQYRQKGVQKGTLCTVVTTKKKQKYVITDLYKGQQYKVRMAIKSGQLTGRYTEWAIVTLSGGKPRKEITKDKTDVTGEEHNDGDVLTTDGDPTSDNDDEGTDEVHSGEIISVMVNKTDYTFEGQNVTLTCAVRYHGINKVSTTWTKGTGLRFDKIGAWFIEITGRHKLVETTHKDGDDTIFISRLTLLKLRTKDSGGYTCHVLNYDQSAEVLLKVTDASPGPPEDIEAEVLSHNSIGVYWSPPKNSEGFPITYELYCWRYRQLSEYFYKPFTAKDITDTQYIVSSLIYDTIYHIGVVAVNKFGRSNFSLVDNVTVTTLDLPPLDISAIRIVNPMVHQDDWNLNDRGGSTGIPDTNENSNSETNTAVVVKIAWDEEVINSWPMMWTQHIIHYKTDDNNTIHQKSVWKNRTIINNLEDDKLYYFRVETVFPGKSIYSPWKKFSTYLTERSAPPPPRDMFLNILTNDSLVIKWLPPPEEYRVRVRHYQLQVAEDDGRRSFIRMDKDSREHIVPIIDRSKTYTVEISAVNIKGLSDSIVRIIDPYRDSSDTGHLIVRPVSSRSIRVSWTTAPNTNLTRFLLRHRAANANISQPKDLFLMPSTTRYLISDLQEHTEYHISLIPYINDVPVPDNLTTTSVWTLSDVPSAPPKAVTVQNINVTNFMISWEPPPEYTQNGKLIFYRVEYRTKFDMTSKNMLVPAGKNELLLTGLEAGIVYEMRVAAVTVNGTGPFSSWVQMVVTISDNTLVIEEPPEAPTNLTVESIPEGITLSWSPPDNNSIPVKGYIVGHGRFIPEVYRKILGPADTEYLIIGLRPNARYILTVRSFNSYGESKPALIKAKSGKKRSTTTTTPEQTTPVTTPIPGSPYDIRIQEQGLEVPTALITWKRPVIRDHIKGYILLYTNNSSLPLYEWTGVFERSLQYVIKNLSFNTTYYIRIQTQLADGTAVMSPTKFFTSRAADKSKDILPKPKFVSAFSGPDNIQISWQPPDYAYIIRGYVLGYGIEQPGEYQEMLPFSETSFIIKRLIPETTYHISLRSFGEFGESEKAVISVSTTG